MPNGRDNRQVGGHGASRSQPLFELEAVDIEITRLEEELAVVEGQLGQTQEVDEARRQVDEATLHKRARDKQLRDIDFAGQDLRERIKPQDRKLYGGTVRNPKELDDLNRQVQHLKDDLRALEDRELDLMAAVEEADRALAAARRQLTEVEQAWRNGQQRLEAEHRRLTEELATLGARRVQRASRVAAADLELSDLLRQDSRGRAVSRIERGTCGVCRIALPASDIRRARSPSEVVRCSSCGRILYAA